MTTDIINSTATSGLSASVTGAATTNEASFSADFETFLTLLTTQLTQQDPLSPMDTDKFTQQLVQYSQVEQSIQTNTNLERMLESMNADRLTTAMDYVGKQVELEGNRAFLRSEGSTGVSYIMPEGASEASVAILNGDNETVARLDIDANPGLQSVAWDGTGANGQRMPPGNYFMRVEAVDADGEPLTVATRSSGIVEGVERDSDDISLIVDGAAFDVSSVRAVNNASIN